jgi:hypothetical protein
MCVSTYVVVLAVTHLAFRDDSQLILKRQIPNLDLRLPPRCLDLRSSGVLRGVVW